MKTCNREFMKNSLSLRMCKLKPDAKRQIPCGSNILLAATVCAAMVTSPVQAQFQWAKRIASTTSLPGGEPDVGTTLDSQGNCYVTGFFDGANNFGGITLTNKSVGGSDIFVAKYNSGGTLQWAQRAGGSSPNLNNGRGIGADTNGNVYVTGGFYGPADFGSFNLPASGYEQAFLAKYNSAGTVEWVQQSGSGGSDVYGTGLAVDGAGNCYAVGFANGGATVTFETISLPNPGYSTFLVKYDNTGTVKWAQLMGGPGVTYACKVAVDAAGNVYVCGSFTENMTIGTSNLVTAGSTKNMFIAKFNNSGALTWVQQPVGGDPGGDGGMAVDQTGNVYVPSLLDSPINFGGISLTNTVTYDAFVAKYSSSGAIQWARMAGGTNLGVYNAYGDNALDSAGNVYAGGTFCSDTVSTNGSAVAVVAKYSPTGTLQWTYTASGPPASPVSSMVTKCAVDSANNCYLAGWYQGTNTFGTNILLRQGNFNIFLAKVAVPVIILSSPRVTGGRTNFTCLLSGPVGSNYVLEASTNLLNWSPVSTSTIPVSGSITLSNAISGYNRRFYRVYLK